MTPDESKLITKLIVQLFPSTTTAQALLVAETARNMRYNRVLAVLKTHARSHDFFSVKGITEALSADHAKAEAMARGTIQDRIIDWLRRTNLEAAGVSDLEALQAHYRRARKEIENPKVDSAGREEARIMARANAKCALMEIGFADADAIEFVADWLGGAK